MICVIQHEFGVWADHTGWYQVLRMRFLFTKKMNHVHFLAAPVRPSGLGFEAGPVAYGTRKRRGGGRWEVEADKYTQNGRASHCEGSLKGLQLSYQRFDWTYGLLCQRTKLLCTIGKENVRRYVFLFGCDILDTGYRMR